MLWGRWGWFVLIEAVSSAFRLLKSGRSSASKGREATNAVVDSKGPDSPPSSVVVIGGGRRDDKVQRRTLGVSRVAKELVVVASR